MAEFIKLEIKTLALVCGLLGNVFLLGWMARSYDDRIAGIEKESKRAAEERKEATADRKVITEKLSKILVIQNDIETIKQSLNKIEKAIE